MTGYTMAQIEDHDGIPFLSHEVGGYRYSFCVKDVAENKNDWLCEIIGRHMDTIYKRTAEETEKSCKLNIKRALGL